MPFTMQAEISHGTGATFYRVSDGPQQVGSINHILAVDGVKAWRFIASKRALWIKMPVPTPPHDTPEAALAYANTLISA